MPKRRKIDLKKRPPALLIVLGLAALAVILFVLFLLNLPRDAGGDDYREKLSAKQVKKLRSYTYNETRELDLCGKRIFRLSSDQLLESAIDGSPIAQENLNFNEIAWSKSPSRIIVGDRRGPGRSAYLFGQDGLVWESPLDGNFAKAVDGGEYIAIVDQPESNYPKLHLLDGKNGLRKYSLSFAESGYIADVKFTPGQKSIDVLLLNLKSSKMKAILKRYDFNGGQMAQFMPAEAEGFFHGLAHQGDNPIIYSVDTIMSISAHSGELDWTEQLAEIFAVESLGQKLYLIARKDLTSPLEFFQIASDGSFERLFSFKSNVQLVERFGQTLVIGAGRDLLIFDLATAKIKESITLPDEAIAISYDGSSTLYILSGTAIAELPLR